MEGWKVLNIFFQIFVFDKEPIEEDDPFPVNCHEPFMNLSITEQIRQRQIVDAKAKPKPPPPEIFRSKAWPKPKPAPPTLDAVDTKVSNNTENLPKSRVLTPHPPNVPHPDDIRAQSKAQPLKGPPSPLPKETSVSSHESTARCTTRPPQNWKAPPATPALPSYSAWQPWNPPGWATVLY